MMEHFKLEKTTITTIAGTCGILLPVIVFICIGFAMSQSPWFRWTQHALSDLGVGGISAAFFNSGMVLGGILAFVFSLGLIKILSNKTGAYILSLSSLALIGIGLFPETLFTIHFIASVLFFTLLLLSLLILGLTIKRDQFERNMRVLALLFMMPAVVSIILLVTLEGVAIPESLVCFPAFLWCMIYGLKMTFM